MVNSVFKKTTIDIHGGGFDLKFPHHENEMAQSMALNHTHLANYWMHVGFLLTDGVKMSKSLGNSILAKDVLERHSGNAIRLFFELTHYRAPVNYTEDNLNNMEKLSSRYYAALKKANFIIQQNNIKLSKKDLIQKDYDEFMSFLADDLNVSNAITVIDKEIKQLNLFISNSKDNLTKIASTLTTILKLTDILGLSYPLETYTDEDLNLYHEYLEARNNKDFAKSDELRAILIQKGIL